MYTDRGFMLQFMSVLKHKQIDTSIEVGAFDADFSKEMSRYIDPKRVWAFEANPEVYNKYKHLLEHINYKNLAVHKDTSDVTLNLITVEKHKRSPWMDGASSVLERFGDSIPTKSITVPGTSLDIFTKENGIDGRIALWIDAEGANQLILENATETLKNVYAIYIEIETIQIWKDQWVKADTVTFLEKQGFTLIAESNSHELKDAILVRK